MLEGWKWYNHFGKQFDHICKVVSVSYNPRILLYLYYLGKHVK